MTKKKSRGAQDRRPDVLPRAADDEHPAEQALVRIERALGHQRSDQFGAEQPDVAAGVRPRGQANRARIEHLSIGTLVVDRVLKGARKPLT